MNKLIKISLAPIYLLIISMNCNSSFNPKEILGQWVLSEDSENCALEFNSDETFSMFFNFADEIADDVVLNGTYLFTGNELTYFIGTDLVQINTVEKLENDSLIIRYKNSEELFVRKE